MSSHHIVREKQEPALLIMSLDGFEWEYLGQLLEWSPTVIVNEPVYKEVENLGIKIDAVLSNKSNLDLLHHTRIIFTNGSPLEDALKFLIGEQYHAVNIISPDFKLKDYALFAEHINLAIFTADRKIVNVKSGFSKWEAKGRRIALIHEVINLHVSGLTHIKNHLYETKKDGFYSLSFDQPFIFVAESISPMYIHIATPEDIPAIHRLAHEIWWPTYKEIIPGEQIGFMLNEMYSVESLTQQFNNRITFILAVRDSIPVGFAAFSVSETDMLTCKIHKLYISLSEQGKGTGKKLIEYIASEAEALQCQLLELNVNRGNPAFNFYKKLGFEIHQTVDISYHQFVLNDYIMRRLL